MHPVTPAPQSAVFVSTVRGWGWGAPDYVWPEAARRLLARRIPVTAIVHPQTMEHPEVVELRNQGAAIFPQPRGRAPGGRWAGWRHRWHRPLPETRLRRHLRSLPRPRFFFNQGGAFDLLDEPFFLPLLEDAGSSYDLFVHLNVPGQAPAAPERAALRRIFLHAARCLFNSAWTRRMTEVQLLQNLPHASSFGFVPKTRPEHPLPWPQTGGTARLAYVGRYDTRQKGLDALLLALAAIRPRHSAWSLDLFGHGPDESDLREMASWLGLDEHVTFHPHTGDIGSIWARHEMLVLPSRYEGLSLSMLEAMACGRPVLRTPYGGCSEWITEGTTGFVCPAPEPALIAATLQRALDARAQWPDMGLHAHNRIRTGLPADPCSVYLQPFS